MKEINLFFLVTDALGQSKKFKCQICFKEYTSGQNLKNHIDGIHADKFNCDFCGRCFSNKFHRDLHVARNSCGKNPRSIEIVPFFIKCEYQRIRSFLTSFKLN